MDKTDLMNALEETSEALEFALSRLGCCGHGDGGDHKADVDDYGGLALCVRNKELLENMRRNNILDVTEAKAEAYDRLMSGGKKTLKEWANFLGMAVAVDRDGTVWAYPYRPVRYGNIWGSDEVIWPSGAFEMPENLVDFNGEWKDSLTLPDEWEAM